MKSPPRASVGSGPGEEIEHRLTPLQYTVTQEAGTGPPFRKPILG